MTKTVAQQWKEKTGLDWSEAKRLGFTDGSYEGNIKLAGQLGTDEFNGQLTNKVINTDSNKKIISDIVGRRNGVQGQSTSTGGQKVSTQGMSANKTNKFLPSIEELVAAAVAGPAPNLTRLVQDKRSANYMPDAKEIAAAAVAGPAPNLTRLVQDKRSANYMPDAKEIAAAAVGPAVNAINLLSNKAPKSNKTKNNRGAVIMSIPTKNGAVMLPIPVNVNAYKKYRDGGQVTIDELFGY